MTSHLNDFFALSLNFDSFSESLGFPSNFNDPCFFSGFDSLLGLLNKYNIKISIYIIGRDLENPEVFSRVRDWSQQGHEIGNHSFSHSMSLGSLSKDTIHTEICRAHELISTCTNQEPVGFISPAWSISGNIIDELLALNYQYDTSFFPSLYLYPMVLKIALNHLTRPDRLREIFGRRDYLVPFQAPVDPFFVDRKLRYYKNPSPDRILSLPLPTTSRISLPLWHTIGFILGFRNHSKKLSKLLSKKDSFYYLIHPADFTDANELTNQYPHTLERINWDIHTKLHFLEDCLAMLASSGRTSCTMSHLASSFLSRRTQS